MNKLISFITFISILSFFNLFGQTADSLALLGINKCNKNQVDSAQLYFKLALELEPYNNLIIGEKFNCYLRNGVYNKALEFVNILIKSDSTNEKYFFMRGLVYEYLNIDSFCMKDYRRAIEINPRYFDAYFNIAAFYYNRYYDIDKEIKTKQDNQISLLESKNESIKLAVEYFEKAYQLEPEDKTVQQTLIDIYNTLNLYDKKRVLEMKINKNNR
ncbi:MAG: tetratricopeptide repeat protein [Bacteroidales bacterium]